jgi:hypothetical protein
MTYQAPEAFLISEIPSAKLYPLNLPRIEDNILRLGLENDCP